MKLKAEKRNIFGKKLEEARDKGKLPAVVYGFKTESFSIFVPISDFKKVWKEVGESGIVELSSSDLDSKSELSRSELNVLIHDVDINPLTDEPRHVDFYVVEMTKKIRAKVPLVFSAKGGSASGGEGVAPAVKNLGAVLVKVLHEVEVEALPKDLPREIKVDISSLKNFDDKITAGDIKMPTDAKILAEPEEIIALVEAPKEEEIVEEAPKIEEIEAIKEKKSADEDADRDADKTPISDKSA